MNKQQRSYMFFCKMRNGRKETRTGYGVNKSEAARCILAMHKDVERVTPNYIILKGA